MATTLLQTVIKPENTSGNIGTYTIKAKEGYIFTSAPQSINIDGNHWDLTGDNNPIVVTSGTDFRETDGAGTGLHGTQTFNFQFQYNIPNLQPSDASTNNIYVNLNTERIKYNCSAINQYITFSNNKPEFARGGSTTSSLKFTPPQATANTFFGSNALYLGIAQQTYSWFVDNESDAFTVYSATPGLSLSATNSKTVNVTTSVYTGSVTIYWGTVTVSCTGNFGKASMIFSDGLRSTKDFIRYEPTCVINITSPASYTATVDSRRITKTDDCDFVLTHRNNTTNADLLLESRTNGYRFSLNNFNSLTSTANAGVGDAELIYKNNLYVAITNDKYTMSGSTFDYISKTGAPYASYIHRSPDRNTWQQCLLQYSNGNTIPSNVRDKIQVHDVCYAGYDSTINNHVWFAIATNDFNPPHTQNPSNLNTSQIYRSVDNAVTFQHLHLSNNYTGNVDFANVRQVSSSQTGDRNARILVDLEKDYGFIFFYRITTTTSTYGSTDYSALFRFFPSQANSGVSTTAADANSNWDVRPVIGAQHGNVNTSSNLPFSSFVYGQNTIEALVTNVNPSLSTSGIEGHLNFEVFDTGICIICFSDKYAVSWNFGLDWAIASLPTINQTHSVNSTSYIYPEHYPTPFLFDNEMYAFTGQISQYFQRNSTGNNRLIYSLMKINPNDSSSLITGNVYNNWSQTYTAPNETVVVTVATDQYGNNTFSFDGQTHTQLSQNPKSFKRGTTITFDQSDSSNAGFRIDFTNQSGLAAGLISNNVTHTGTPGTAGAQTQLVIPKGGFTEKHFYFSYTSGATYTVNIVGNRIDSHYPVLATDLISSWEVVTEYDFETVTDANTTHGIYDILVDDDQPDNVKRIYAATSTPGVIVTPSPPAPTIVDGASQPTITAPSLPSGTTLENATGDPFLTEVYSDNPFSIVFTRGDGTQMQFDGVFDIIVLSSTRPYIINTVSNQTYTKFEGTFNATSGAANISGGTFQNSTIRIHENSVPYNISDYNNFGFVYKYYAYQDIRTSGNVISNLRYITNRTDLQLNANIGSGGALIKDLLNNGTISTPSGYSFSHRPTNASYYAAHPNPLYLDHMTAFTKRINNNYFDVGNFEVGLKLYTDPQGTPYLGGYYWRRNWNFALQTLSSAIGSISDWNQAVPNFGELDVDPNFMFVNSDGFITELGDNRLLPDYDKCP